MEITSADEYTFNLIHVIIDFSQLCQERGILILEKEIPKLENDFLRFGVEFMLKACKNNISAGQISEILNNYAVNSDEVDKRNNIIIVNGLMCILAGESQFYLKELLCSFLGVELSQRYN